MVFDREVVTKSAGETAEFGEKVGYQLRTQMKRGRGRAKVICLYGELGSGKTTFVQGFARGLGITSRLLSPTFIIVRRYPIPSKSLWLYHIDLYRIQKPKELVSLGLSEILSDRTSFVLIEWAEKLGSWMPKQRRDIRFYVLPDGRHAISMEN